MSGLSLISSAETLAASFQLLIDEILIADEAVDKRLELAALLHAAAAAGKGATSHNGLLLDSLLRDPDGKARQDLKHLARAVEQASLTEQDKRSLADIAGLISTERAALSSRMSVW